MLLKSSWKLSNNHTNFCSEWVLGFEIDNAWISKFLIDVAFTWRPKELSCWLQKWLVSGILAVSEPFMYYKILFYCFLVPWDIYTFVAKPSDRYFCWFAAANCWCPSGWAPVWRLHQISLNLGNKKFSPHILLTKKLLWPESWRESLHINLFFLDSRLYLLNSFDFYFNMALHWKPAITEKIYSLWSAVSKSIYRQFAIRNFLSRIINRWSCESSRN